MRLTNKQADFAKLVAEGSTYANAYREAYPVSKKWKDESVWCESSKLMTDTKVLQRVAEIQNRTEQRNEASLDQVLSEMRDWVLFDPIEMFDENDCIRPIQELPSNVRKSIASLEVVELFATVDKEKVKIGELKKVKLVDKRATADMFMKKFGAYLTKVSVDVEDLSHLKEILDGINP